MNALRMIALATALAAFARAEEATDYRRTTRALPGSLRLGLAAGGGAVVRLRRR